MRAQLVEFVQQLRVAGLRVSVAETLDAMAAVVVVGIDPVRLRESLSATLVKDELDRATFERTFDAYFAAPATPTRPGRGRGTGPAGGESAGRGGGRAGASGATAGGKPPPDAEPSPDRHAGRPSAAPPVRPETTTSRRGRTPAEHRPRAESTARESDRESKAPAHSPAAGGADRLRATRAIDPRALLRRPLAEMTPDELDAARELARELGRRFAARAGRRWRRERTGRIDVRRTIRASIGRGGAMFRLERRGRRPGRPGLVVLCDVSGSVSRATEILLSILGAADTAFRRVSRFIYVDRAVPASFEGGHVVPEGEIDLWARSDLGRVLCEVEARHAALVDRSTVLLLLGDGRNNRLAHRADALARLRHRARGVVFAVAEPRVRWNTGDSALAAYAPHCDLLLETVSLGELLRALRAVAVR